MKRLGLLTINDRDTFALYCEAYQDFRQSLETIASEGEFAINCERGRTRRAKETPKPLQIADLGDGVREDATNRESSGRGTRTPDTRIMIQSACAENAGKATGSESNAAPGAADESQNGPLAPDQCVVANSFGMNGSLIGPLFHHKGTSVCFA